MSEDRGRRIVVGRDGEALDEFVQDVSRDRS